MIEFCVKQMRLEIKLSGLKITHWYFSIIVIELDKEWMTELISDAQRELFVFEGTKFKNC
jgi:hypothetical protein